MFVLALLGGIIGIILPQYLQLSILSILLPILCMIIYTVVGYMQSTDSIFVEQFADSVYYLGFLLTLIALVTSLYSYEDEVLETGALIANFSLALLTTIFGLAVRIYINNFQIDLRSADRFMMTGIEHAANELVRKAKLISMQMDVSHQETQISINKSIGFAAESMEETAKTIENFAEQGALALAENIEQANKRAMQAVEQFENRLINTKVPQEVLSEKLNQPIHGFLSKLDEMQAIQEKINQLNLTMVESSESMIQNMGKVTLDLNILGQGISGFNDKLTHNMKVNDEFISVVKDIALLSERTLQISENIENQTRQSKQAMDNFSQFFNKIEVLPIDLENLSYQIKQSTANVSEIFTHISQDTASGVQIASDLKQISSSLANTKDTVAQISDFGIHITTTFKRLETFNNLIDQHTELLKDMAGVARLDIEMAKEHQDEMANILAQSRKSMAMMNQDILSSVHQLSQQLRN